MEIPPYNELTPAAPSEKIESNSSESKHHEKIQPLDSSGKIDVSTKKWALYESSLAFTQLKGYAAGHAWWSKIGDYSLYLGGIPLKNKGHLEQIKKLGVTRVICLVEPFELQGTFNEPIQKEDWGKVGIQVDYIPAIDFLPLTPEQFEAAVSRLATLLEAGETVYIHCKAGVGRSASIVVAYLMKHRGMSFEDAIAVVTQYRPHISLNPGQRQAIRSYIQGQPSPELISEEIFAKFLTNMLDTITEGIAVDSRLPPSLKITSTLAVRNLYLRTFQGNQELAVQAAIKDSHSFARKLVTQGIGFIPLVGGPTSYSISVWCQLREIALIAALYGHNLKNPEVKMKILSCLLDGNVMKIPAQGLDIIAKKTAKEILLRAGLSSLPGATLPAHLIFNYVTDNAAKVSTYAKATFGGDQAKAILPSEYTP